MLKMRLGTPPAVTSIRSVQILHLPSTHGKDLDLLPVGNLHYGPTVARGRRVAHYFPSFFLLPPAALD